MTFPNPEVGAPAAPAAPGEGSNGGYRGPEVPMAWADEGEAQRGGLRKRGNRSQMSAGCVQIWWILLEIYEKNMKCLE